MLGAVGVMSDRDGDNSLGSLLRDLTECPICRETLADPKTLPCLHTFCCSCLAAHSEGTNTATCPSCRQVAWHYIIPCVPSSGVARWEARGKLGSQENSWLRRWAKYRKLCMVWQPNILNNCYKLSGGYALPEPPTRGSAPGPRWGTCDPPMPHLQILAAPLVPSVLWRCWLGGRKGIRPVKKLEWWGAGVVICLQRDADLHVAQLMPLPLTVACFTKI